LEEEKNLLLLSGIESWIIYHLALSLTNTAGLVVLDIRIAGLFDDAFGCREL